MRTVLALAALAFLLQPVAIRTAAAQDLVITNVRVIVGNGQVVDQGTIVVRGGRIVSAGQGAAPAGGGRTIDGRGMTAMPGFIDGHRHIMGGNAAQWMKDQAPARLQEFLESGYTTLMSGGGPVPGIIQLKEAIEKGQLKGPRIVTSGRADPDSFKTEADARAAVQRLAKAGVPSPATPRGRA